MDPLLKTALLRTLGFLLWASLSAWLFVFAENTGRNDREEKYHLLYSLYETMASKYNMSTEEFNNFSNVAYEALSEPDPEWNFHAALDFVFQTLTTIGYGYITPQTPTGQTLCVFVSLLGIPMTMLALKSIGELIAKCVSTAVTKFEKKILKKPESKRLQSKSAVILFSLMVLMIVGNGLLTVPLRKWSLLEGVYFWFVTLTTIGFGDYVPLPSQRIRKLTVNSSRNYEIQTEDVDAEDVTISIFTRTFFTFYFILCLCIVSSVLNSIMAAIEEHKCSPLCPGCVPRKTRDHTDTEQNNTQPAGRETNVTYLNMENFEFQQVTPISASQVN